MDAFSIWHWLIILLGFGVPAIIVAIEKSNKKTSRKQLLFWILGLTIGILLIGFLLSLVVLDQAVYHMSIFVIGAILTFPLYQQYVRRARDTGIGKTIVDFSILPIGNAVCPIILLFKSSAEASKTD